MLARSALYNAIRLRRARTTRSEEFDADEPPPSTVILSIGTIAAILIITTGSPILAAEYCRSAESLHPPIDERLKLTFAKQSTSKRNAPRGGRFPIVSNDCERFLTTSSRDGKRSIGFFPQHRQKKPTSPNCSSPVTLVKMPGLRGYSRKKPRLRSSHARSVPTRSRRRRRVNDPTFR